VQRYILSRVFYALISLFLLSITVFGLVRITGDPVVLMAEPGAKEEDLQALRREFGLDKPIYVQYGVFIAKLMRGDFGKSLYYRVPVLELYLSRLPATIELAGVAMLISILLGVPIGIFAAVRVNTWLDSFSNIFANLGLALPSFWVGLLLILIFSVDLNWLPSSGAGTAKHIIMPAVALGWVLMASNMRLARSAMLEVLGSEYVKLARIKGLSERLVILKHAFKNAMIPVLTFASIQLALVMNGTVVVETIFAWPGIGRLAYEGISFRDFPVVQTTALLCGLTIVMVNLMVDILYAYIDPRIRYGQ
jgi:ABC-type dipeptide/oligopeptide/nickel transport system permease component